MTNERITFTMHPADEFLTARAATFLNFATQLRITHAAAHDIAIDALDDAAYDRDAAASINPLDAIDAPRALLTALANESFNSDDDFDDFLHELRHTLNDCDDDDFCADDDD